MEKVKTLVLDIETSPIRAWVWGLRDQNIALNQIDKDWHIMAWAAKWLGEPASKIKYEETRTDNDKAILKKLWNLLDEADVLVTQNGASFDIPRIDARMRIHKMRPYSPSKHADTYRMNKKAGFTSHKLSYLNDVLCPEYAKSEHPEFPGMSLWTECLKGNPKAWKVMKKYNIKDVLGTEALHNITNPWAPASTTRTIIAPDPGKKCEVCGSPNVYRRGRYVLKHNIFEKWHCQSCGAWRKGRKVK